MLRKIVLIFLFSFLFFTGFTQNFNGGIILGADISQLDGDGWGAYNKFGFLGGAFVSLQISERSSLQLEMEYIGKGSIAYDSSGQNDFLFRFHYLEIPLLYQYSFGKGRRFSIEAGPAADVLLGSREEVNGFEAVATEPLRRLTLSGIFGFSSYLTEHLKLNMRINYSLLSVRDTKAISTFPESYRWIFFEKGQFNNVLSLSFLWYFRPHDF